MLGISFWPSCTSGSASISFFFVSAEAIDSRQRLPLTAPDHGTGFQILGLIRRKIGNRELGFVGAHLAGLVLAREEFQRVGARRQR